MSNAEHSAIRAPQVSRVHLLLLQLGALATTVFLLVGIMATVASAESCPNEPIRDAEPYAAHLPDCRAYEQVSPVGKNGNDALGEVGQVRASQSGNAVTYFSLSPFSGLEGASAFPTYMSIDMGEAWATRGMEPLTEPSEQAFVTGLTPELTSAVVNVRANSSERVFIRDTATGELALVATGGRNKINAQYASATPGGSRIIFDDSGAELIPGVLNETFEPYVYEWDVTTPTTGHLSLISVVGGVPVPAVAGAATEAPAEGSISADGSRVYFTDTENAHVFLREPDIEATRAVSLGEAVWRAATPDGKFAFYTEEGGLFRFDADPAAAEVRGTIAGTGSGTLGVLGTSADGSRAFFVAQTVLATNTNAMGEVATNGGFNLYEWHEGTPVAFVEGLMKTMNPTGSQQ